MVVSNFHYINYWSLLVIFMAIFRASLAELIIKAFEVV